MKSGCTTLLPLGGLSEIGLNCLAVETERDLLLVDCGLAFPRAEQPGVEYLIPDLDWVRARSDKLRGVLLTHGHEDHIGALPHLLQELPVPVYGSRFTLALVQRRLLEYGGGRTALLHTVAAGAEVVLGTVRACFLPVAHSIPDACAVVLETPGGVVLHSGDFTFDPAPAGGQATDAAALEAWGNRGVDLLCCDSTNALRPGATPASATVAAGLARIVPTVEGRLYVALFASNVARMQQVVEASRRCGRQVAPLGRAVEQISHLARQYGYLRTAPGEWLAESRCHGLPRGALTVLCGGTQAEPGSALWRVAHGAEPHHRLQPGDAVVFSARAIPGNEGAIGHLLDRCVTAGARVYFGADDGVHVSGHPGAPELGRLLELTRPRQVLPVHGSPLQRAAAARVARAAGWADAAVLCGAAGREVILEGGRARLGEAHPARRQCVRGDQCFSTAAPFLAARRRMGGDGMALALLGGASPWSVRVELCGVVPGEADGVLAAAAAEAVRDALEPLAAAPAPGEAEASCRAAEQALRRFFRRRRLGRPWVEVRRET